MSHRAWSIPTLPTALVVSALIAGLSGIVVAFYMPNAYDQTIPPLVALGAILGAFAYDTELRYDAHSLDREWVTVLYFVVAGIAVFAYATAFQRSFVANASLVGLYLVSVLGVVAFESPAGKLSLPLITAVLHRAFVYYASAVQLGLDALFHNAASEAIGASGTMEALSLSKYWYSPGYHALTATSASVFDVPVRDAAFVSVSLVMVLVVAVAVFAIVRGSWGDTVGALAALVVLVGDSVLYASVHTTPTTLGVVFFVLLFPFVHRYLAAGDRRYFGAIVLAVAGVGFTHQFSLFVILVAVGVFSLVYSVWARKGERYSMRALHVEVVLLGAFVLQSVLTRYDGPAGESSRSFLTAVVPDFLGAFAPLVPWIQGSASTPPPGYVLSGADALDVPQVLGKGILFCFALVGLVYWIGRHESDGERTAMAFGATVATVSTIVFGGGLVGVSAFLPRRWFVFLLVPLAILAAPGILALGSRLSRPFRDPAIVLVVLLLVTAPYVAFMFASADGSPDDPILDGAPGAYRISTTPTEAASYTFVDDYAGEATVVADHLAWQTIERHYGQPAEKYTTESGEDETVFDGQQLIVYRSYATTKHASYVVRHRGTPYRVVGPLPRPGDADGVIYVAGTERVVYRSD